MTVERNNRKFTYLLLFGFAALLAALALGVLPLFAAIDSSSFAPKVNFPAGSKPWGIAIGDIDGDSKLDLAVANWGNIGSNNTVSVLQNTSTPGTVSFVSVATLIAGTGPVDLVLCDIEGNGKLDLLVANYGDPSGNGTTVSVFQNTSTSGTVSFASAVTFAVRTGPRGIACGDFDGDSKLDLVVANYASGTGTTIAVLQNTRSTTGTISFAPPVTFTAGTGPIQIALGDIDVDSKLDLAVTNYGSLGTGTTVSVLRNTTTGGIISFAPAVTSTVGIGPVGVALGDIAGNGKLDLVIANNGSTGNGTTVSVLRNTSISGTVSFDPKIDVTLGSGPYDVAVSDLDGDGQLDLVVTNYGSSGSGTTLSVLQNVSTGGVISFAPKVDFSTGNGPLDIVVGDIDKDGNLDIAVTNHDDEPSNAVSVLRQKATPSFSNLSSPTITYGTPSTILSGTITAGSLFPSGIVSITLNSVTQAAAIDGATGNFSSTFTTSGLNVSGSPYMITYTYPGDTNFTSAGPDTSKSLTINKANTNTTAATSKTPSTFGESVTFTATVTSTQDIPTGTATFKDGGSSIGVGALNSSGVATLTTSSLIAGSHSITVVYGGDTNFSSSTLSAITQTVNKADTTTTITSDLPDPSIAGQSITVNYSVLVNIPGNGTPTGNVTITVNDASGSICTGTVAAGSCNITLSGAGFKTLTATYSGDSNFNGSSGTIPHQVNPAKLYLPLIQR